MFTREIAIEKVKSFALELRANGMRLDKVILFGSFARNHQNAYSDIDVALVSDMFTGFGFEDRKLFSRINIKREFIDIETKTYSKEYFEAGDPFIEEIKKTGIVIM
ncbi:MAG: nucleotidyltransferase domain-containing protein [FCB group bacterium]|jgi:predicted nucleotidyltransferase